jgi:hypothetical protein
MKILLIFFLVLFSVAGAHSQDDPDPQVFFSKVKSLEELFVIMEKARPDSGSLYSFFIDSMACIYWERTRTYFDSLLLWERRKATNPIIYKSVEVHYRTGDTFMERKRFYSEQEKGISIFKDKSARVYELAFSDGQRLASYSAYWIYIRGRWQYMDWI